MAEDADRIEIAVANVLNAGLRTGDIMQPGKKLVSTTGMGQAVLAEVERLSR
jgi:3-isopropylmalate dehydrogenase